MKTLDNYEKITGNLGTQNSFALEHKEISYTFQAALPDSSKYSSSQVERRR